MTTVATDNPAAPDVDDTDLDVPLASSTTHGAGSQRVALNMSLPPKAKIRVVTASTTSTFGMVQVEFFPTLDKFERIIN